MGKGIFPNMSEEKARLIAEILLGFIGLVLLYAIGVFWNWLFLREGTSFIGWVIYFIGGAFLFFKALDKTFKWFKKLFVLLTMKK